MKIENIKINQKKLAQEIGVSKQMVSAWIRGKRKSKRLEKEISRRTGLSLQILADMIKMNKKSA